MRRRMLFLLCALLALASTSAFAGEASPPLAITVTGNPVVNPGDQVMLEIELENTGTEALTGIVLSTYGGDHMYAVLPAGERTHVLDIVYLDKVGGVFTYDVRGKLADGTEFTMASEPFEVRVSASQKEVPEQVNVEIEADGGKAKLQVIRVITPNTGRPNENGMVRLYYMVRNTGNGDLTDVSIIDDGPLEGAEAFGNLDAGAASELMYSAIVGRTPVYSQATVRFTTADGTQVAHTLPRATFVPKGPYPQLTLESASGIAVRRGEYVDLIARLENPGMERLENIRLTSPIFGDIDVLSELDAGHSSMHVFSVILQEDTTVALDMDARYENGDEVQLRSNEVRLEVYGSVDGETVEQAPGVMSRGDKVKAVMAAGFSFAVALPAILGGGAQ